ncbi:MAG: hypothetical protein ABR518_07520 [Actinomycetota bacterium]
MTTRPRPLARVGSVIALGAALSLGIFQSSYASVDPKPGDRVSGTVDATTSQLPSEDSPTEPTAPEPREETAPSSSTEAGAESTSGATGAQKADDDSPGHETPDPGPPDHARGAIAEVSLGGNELVAVGQTNAQINDDGTSQGDVTVLSLGGQEVIGAHSDSEGEESATLDPFAPLCEGSGGAVCLGLLFADTNSSTTATTAHSDASTAIAALCLGGTNPDPGTTCDGQVSASVARSSSTIDRDYPSNSETATQETDLADACVGGENETGACNGVGATAIHSESTSSVSDGQTGQTESSSYLANVQLGGQEFVVISDPTAITLPPNCPTPSLVCLFLNQGTETVGAGFAGSGQEAVHLGVLTGVVGGADFVLTHAGTAETFVRQPCPPGSALRECNPPPSCPTTPSLCPRKPPALAVTGFDIRMALGVTVVLFVLGTTLVALSRRRRLALA